MNGKKSTVQSESNMGDKGGAAPPISFNKEKKKWQTPDGRLFATLKKANDHLNGI